MDKAEKAILLINIGSPDNYSTGAVRRYLRQFLGDKRVIDIPYIPRKLLVNGIIAPFRAPRSAKKYKEIWTEKGSPLIIHSNNLKNKLQKLFASRAHVYFAMRYGNPGIEEILREIHSHNYSELIIVPMYPQNASSTTSSSLEEVHRVIGKWENYPRIRVIGEFWNHPQYISALAKKVKQNNPEEYDHIIVSFHGLPLSQVYASYKCSACALEKCLAKPASENRYCYQAQCYHTMDLLMKELQISKENYSIGFQSRLTKNWLSPFTDKVLEELAAEGKTKVMVICPSFVSDCLETIHEIEIELAHDFKTRCGKKLLLVPALNDDDEWVKGLKHIIETT